MLVDQMKAFKVNENGTTNWLKAKRLEAFAVMMLPLTSDNVSKAARLLRAVYDAQLGSEGRSSDYEKAMIHFMAGLLL